MDLDSLLAARREAGPDAPPIADLAAAERALLDACSERPSAAWIEEAARVVAEHQREGRAERAWPLLRVMEPWVAALADPEPASAGRVIAALAAQALLEGSAEAFLERARFAAEAFERAGLAGEAAIERAAYGAALFALGMDDEAEYAIEAAIEGSSCARLPIAEALARRCRAELRERRGSEPIAGDPLVGPPTNAIAPGAVGWLAGGPAPVWIAIADMRAASGDAAGASAAMAEARRAVLAFGSRLARPEIRKSYLERIPAHRRALSLDPT